MKKLKVLLVSEYFPPKTFGGGEISAYHLAKSLAEEGVSVFVLTSYFKGLKRFGEKDGIKILRTLKTGNNPNSITENLKRKLYFQKSLKKDIFKIDNKENFDVIHFLNTTSIPSFKIKKKTIATINGYTNFCPKRNLFYKEREVCSGCNFPKFLGCIVNSENVGKIKISSYLRFNPLFWLLLYFNYLKKNKTLKHIDKFISISDFITKQLEKNGVKRKNIEKIYNIQNIKESGEKFDIKEKGVIVTYIGALEKLKGVDILIKAFNKIHGDAKLLIFGEGSQIEYLESIANKNVRFYGSIDYSYIPSIYTQSDIIVQPALWPEPFSRIMLEATYFGKPIIATDNGGNSEGVIDEKNGFLINNEEQLKQKLEKLIKHKTLREKMALESKRLFKEKFSKKVILSKYKKILNY
ncbi:MAG: glycosyltransferase family 4 protein [Nanoarchaeota archaeon]|nr:glycosyltransferase family 4 protein [DPANN group archaeon]MBL7116657.1 glycosyltransferase family 4 protein [Nanoarchaeota archaeon]